MWRYEQAAGKKPTKVPYRIDGRKASTTTESDFANFDMVCSTLQSGGYDGIGIVLSAEYVGIDLDDSLADGRLKPWAAGFVKVLGSYTEISPSGNGVKIWTRASLGDRPGRKKIYADGKVEVYSSPRYFTVTGNIYNGCPLTVEARQGEVDRLYAWLTKPDTKPSPKPTTPASERCRKYLEKCGDSIEGQDGSGRCFHAACICFRFGLSESEAFDVMTWYGNAKSQPPWSEREIRHKLKGAFDKVRAAGELGMLLHNDAKPKLETSIAPPPAESTALATRLNQIKSGELADVAWPYSSVLTMFARPLAMQTTLVICGAGGSTKSLFLMEASLGWLEADVPFAVFHLEEDREFHQMRAMAQLAGNSKLTDPGWVKENPAAADDAYQQHMGTLDALGRCIWDAPENDVCLYDLTEWVNERAKEGRRIIAVDPVTAADSGREPWAADRKFILDTKRIMRAHKSSLVLVTHPRQSNAAGENRLDNLAGGKAYNRFTQCVLWMAAQNDQYEMVRQFGMGLRMPPTQETVNRKIQIVKSRNGRGGVEVGYYFDSSTLRFRECGIIDDGK